MSGVGVVAAGWFVAEPLGRDRVAVKLPASWKLADLLPAVFAADAGVVLVHPTEQGWDGDASGWEVSGEVGGEAWRFRHVAPVAYLCGPGAQGRVGGQRVSVVFLDRDTEGAAGRGWVGVDARQLLDAMTALRRLLGVDWCESVGLTAERLIMATHPRGRGGTTLDVEPKIPAPVDNGNLELPWSRWRRDRDAGELAAPWVHVFDANAQYLAAWIAAELGHGEPRHEVRPHFDPRGADVWRFDGGLDGLGPLPGHLGRLPEPWMPGREWYTTPTVRRVVELGDAHGFAVPAPVDAYLWPKHSRFLRGAGERLRDARRDARAAHAGARADLRAGDDGLDVAAALNRFVVTEAVVDAVKDLYTKQTGRLNMAARDERSGWRRPDWGHTVRATSRCNLHRRLAGLGAQPFAIVTDALVFVTDVADAAAFARSIRLPIGDGLGEFKIEGTATAGDVDGLDELAGLQLMEAIAKAVRGG